MKPVYVLMLAGAAAMAQTPAPSQKAPAKKTTSTAPRPNPLLNPSGLTAVAPAVFRVNFTTTHGDFVVEVHREWAPRGADRFYNLVRNGFFTNAAFFRVMPNFIVQFGESADPAVSKVWKDATVKDDPVKQSNKRGYLTFATAGPGTRTTQLFINLRDNTPLDKDPGVFAPFGQVVEGMEIVDGIYSGYGEMPDQQKIEAQGKAYLDRNFPKLDLIKLAKIAPVAPAAGTAVKTAPATSTPPKKQ